MVGSLSKGDVEEIQRLQSLHGDQPWRITRPLIWLFYQKVS
jgi:hypothetical protein